MDGLVKRKWKKIIKPVSDALKNLKEKINAIFEKEKKFEVREGQSALNNFAREYIIDGRPGYGPQRFFKAVRNLIKILQENKNTKTKIMMLNFIQKLKKNLAETDEKKLLDKMIARIGEVLANFQQSGSNWVFQKIIRLEIHFANWQPIGGSTFFPLPAKIKNKSPDKPQK